MTTPFGPQLIGETEKTLNALLLRLAAAVADRAHFPDAVRHVDDLTGRGLLDDGHLTADSRDLLTRVQTLLAHDTGVLFGDLPADDVAATERVLNELVSRARVALAS